MTSNAELDNALLKASCSLQGKRPNPGVLVQRMLVPADRAIALRICYGFYILRRRILTELVFGGHDARQTEITPNPASEELARLREVGGAPRDRAGPLCDCICACLRRR